MRPILALLLLSTAVPAFAETIPAESTITAVTVYPEGAMITREVRFVVPAAGAHEVLVTDLPGSTESGPLQIAGSEGLNLGAFSLRDDELPPRDEPLTPEQEAAKAEVERLEAAERDALAAVDAVQARIDAALAQAAFLSSFSGALPDGVTPETLKATAAMIGAETLAAREAAAAARKDLWPAQQALSEVQEDLAKAREALAALPARDSSYKALSVAVEAAAAGEATMVFTYYIDQATWRPFYKINLTRQGEPKLTMERSVLVDQYTGEDWTGVDLTLSTSQPVAQSAPSGLWPELRSIGPEEPPVAYENASDESRLGAEPEVVVAEPVYSVSGMATMEGDTVVYKYPRKVDVATGDATLSLPLDELSFVAEVEARAVPRYDTSAFVMASFIAGDEPIVPGSALIFREGVLVGEAELGPIAPGAEAELAFGALESIRIRRDMPVRAGGETGILTTSNEVTEEAVITVENLGDETWPVRVLDQVPYSEQTDLEIEVSAAPEPSETDVDGQRGILAWDITLAAGEQKTVTLGYTMSWPDGMVLR